MLSAVEKQALRKKLEEYEGSIEHLYLDSKGYVTVGTGHLLPTLQSAQKLSFYTQTGAKATSAQIKIDYDAVKKQPANRLAIFYKRFTTLKMKKFDIDALTNTHIDSFYKELKQIYVDFEKFPSEAKLALFDLIFNVGMTDLKNNWPSLNKAVKARDWAKASAESNRKPPVSALRNKYVRDLFTKAVNAKSTP